MPDKFLYFAYGSNMLTRRLRDRTPSAVVAGIGFIEGYRLAFDKVSSDGSGKCNIDRTGNAEERVYGVLFNIDVTDSDALDRAEGLGKGYLRGEVLVIGAGGSRTALAYIADHTDAALLPYDWYKDFVVHGAIEHGLPAAYLRRLQIADCKPDPNTERSSKNRALLSYRQTSLNCGEAGAEAR